MHALAQCSLASDATSVAREIVEPDVGRVSDNGVVARNRVGREKVANFNVGGDAFVCEKRTRRPGTALVDLRPRDAHLAGQCTKRCEFFGRPQHKSSLTTRRLKNAVVRPTNSPLGDEVAHEFRSEECSATFTQFRCVAREHLNTFTQHSHPPVLSLGSHTFGHRYNKRRVGTYPLKFYCWRGASRAIRCARKTSPDRFR